MTASLRVSVLGRVRAWVDGAEIDLGPARQRALFAILAAEAGRTVGRDELIEALWGASAPVTAAGSVYTYVSGLRRRLRPGLLTSGSYGYALDVSRDALDVEVFQRLRTEASARLAGGDADGAADRLTAALGLWRGDAYAGLPSPLLELERERLNELRLTAVEHRARLLLERGQSDGLVAELAGLTRTHTLHEPLHELLMRALDRAGRHADAIEVFHRMRRTLQEELGVGPGPALRAVHHRVLTRTA